MCVICIKEKGVNLPSKDLMRMMWNKNPHGAGYMFARSNYVYIRKGFMSFDEFYKAVCSERLTKDDVVVYHFRISTQAGVNPEMTHPFMLTDDLEKTKVLRTRTNMGIVHNGIIPLTSNGDIKYSDTAYFITDYLYKMISKPSDLRNESLLPKIESLLGSKMAILDYAGNVTTIGRFVTDNSTGLKFSNTYFMSYYFYGVA